MGNDRGRVLIVDDESEMRSLLHDVLAADHDVVLAADGIAACAKLETARFDVVLTDVRMPGPDGFELARLIRKKWPLTEVVLMTAYASIPEAVDAARLGVHDYISKPFHPDDVTLVVTHALEQRRDRARFDDATVADARLATLSYSEALAEARDRGSRQYLTALLRLYAGNVSRAAEHARLGRVSFHRALRRHGIEADTFRTSDDEQGDFKPSRT